MDWSEVKGDLSIVSQMNLQLAELKWVNHFNYWLNIKNITNCSADSEHNQRITPFYMPTWPCFSRYCQRHGKMNWTMFVSSYNIKWQCTKVWGYVATKLKLILYRGLKQKQNWGKLNTLKYFKQHNCCIDGSKMDLDQAVLLGNVILMEHGEYLFLITSFN